MYLLNWLYLLAFTLASAFSVSRENFKDCDQSSFCTRQHSIKPQQYTYSILKETVKVTPHEITALLKSPSSSNPLTLKFTYVGHDTYRVQIDEVSTDYRRYRIPVGVSLKAEPTLHPIKVSSGAGRIEVTGSDTNRAVISINPFSIQFYIGGVVVSTFNNRQLLNFENTAMPHIFDGKRSNNNISDAGHPTENADTVSNDSSAESKTDITPKDNEQLISDTTVDDQHQKVVSNDVPESHSSAGFSWSETFRSHDDSRPNGPTSISVDIDFPDFTHLYGIPEHADNFNLKNTEAKHPYRLYNLDVFEYELYNPMALYGSVPVLWAHNSNNTVGIFWMNPSETWVDIDVSNGEGSGFFSRLPNLFSQKSIKEIALTRWISETGIVDTFFMLGGTPLGVSKAYLQLTGATPLPPLFALAYHQSRWNYNDEADVSSIDENFDVNKLPLDVIWLDIEHTDGKRYFTWDKVKFPTPEVMVDKLSMKGRKLVTVVDPHLKKDSSWDLFNNAQNQGYFIKSRDGSTYEGWCWPGSSAWPDFTRLDVRQWWAQLYTTYEPVRNGTMFSWNDMGEPSVFNGPEITMHKDALHGDGYEHRDIHNLYGLLVHQATWDGHLLRSVNTERPFVLTRAFFAGSQRTASVWTGDNTANWEHLRISIPMLLSLSITGITLCGADIGGFFGNPDAELLTRWYQAAAYQPFMRAHAHIDTKRREPWLYPEANLNIIRSAVEDRYRLLPYWYTLFAQAEADGQPVMAPVWYHFPTLQNTFSMDSQYMLGQAILVAPVTKAGATRLEVYLPPGTWYHMPSTKFFTGGQTIQFSVTLETIPVFYRGGYIVPRRERIRRSSWSMRHDPYTLFVFIDSQHPEARGYLYADDFHSLSRAGARHFRLDYSMDPNLLDARLRITQIQVPGSGSLSLDTNSGLLIGSIERIVFVGFNYKLQRATLLKKHGVRRDLEFSQDPKLPSKDTHDYMRDAQTGVLVIRNAQLELIGDHWSIHLVTDGKLIEDL